MRDLLIFGIFMILTPLALNNAFIAYLVWAWTTALAIDSYTFGFMQSVRLNLTFSIIASCLIFFGKDKEKLPFKIDRTLFLLGLFLLQATISNFFAYADNVASSELYFRLVKVLFFCLLMPMVITNRYRIHCFVIVLLVGLGFHGVVEGLKVASSGGGHHVLGLAKYGDNNQFALAMVVAVPLFPYMYKNLANQKAKLIVLGALLLMLVCIIGTYSRGAFVGLVAIALWAILNAKKKLLGFLVVLICAGFMVYMAPDAWSERMNTIKEADEDSSFMTRVVAWKVSSAIALENPLTGGGLRAVVVGSVWKRFKETDGLLPFVATPYRSETPFVAHSIYFEVLGDLGFLGLFIFLAIFINAFHTWFLIKKRIQQAPADRQWLGDLANALAGSVFAYLVAGAALSMAYFEIIYMLIVLLELLKREAFREEPVRIVSASRTI